MTDTSSQLDTGTVVHRTKVLGDNPTVFYDGSGLPFGGVGRMRYELQTEHGLAHYDRPEREQPDGTSIEVDWTTEVQLPSVVEIVPGRPHDCLIWIVPADDTSFRSFFAVRGRSVHELVRLLRSLKQDGKPPWEMTEEDSQRSPADVEAGRAPENVERGKARLRTKAGICTVGTKKTASPVAGF